MNRFAFTDCTTVGQALAELGRGAEIKAGGIDLLDRMKDGVSSPSRLVNIRNIRALEGIQDGSSGLKIGPLATLAEIQNHQGIREKYAALADAAGHAATPQIRNMATAGGNLLQRPRCWYFREEEFHCLKKGGDKCFAIPGEHQYHAIFDNGACAIVHPSALAVPLMAMNAQIELTSNSGKRTIPMEQFFVTPEQNVLVENVVRPDELLTAIQVPKPAAGARSAYQKYGEKESFDWPLADAGVVLEMQGNVCRRAAIVLGAAAPVPMRATGAESLLANQPISEELARAAGRAAMRGATPLERNGYKIPMFETAIYRTILLAAGMMDRDPSAVGGAA